MNLSASMIKELREKSGAGMMDCKKALLETKCNMEDAIDWLRKQGLSAVAKKSGRVAAEGLIGISIKDIKGAMIEINSEQIMALQKLILIKLNILKMIF